ncbi:MAG: DUF4292 domain-containing protein [Muribaculaceae bacterium]|nr:DUF4292 domain-containing protein [Muribaculaceae bacterium]
MNRHSLLLATAAALAIVLAACGGNKSAVGSTGSSDKTPTLTPSADATPAERYAAMTAAYGLWHDVQLPVKATLRSPANLSASGRLTMVCDSLVHLSMRVLGMEVAVVRMTRDSVHVYDKFHRYLFAESIRAVQARTGLTLADMQCALLGRAFVPGAGVATARSASSLRLGGTYPALDISAAHSPSGYEWSMKATTLADARVALQSIAVSAGSVKATCTYTPAPSLTATGAVASALDINATIAKKQLSARLQYTLDDARWNTRTVPAAPSARGYQRLPASALPRMFQIF